MWIASRPMMILFGATESHLWLIRRIEHLLKRRRHGHLTELRGASDYWGLRAFLSASQHRALAVIARHCVIHTTQLSHRHTRAGSH